MPTLRPFLLLYLHGFGSSPASLKARQLQARMTERGLGRYFACPQLPVSPKETVALVAQLIARAPGPVTLVGSSLGGHYATWLAERHPLQAVLINPAVVAHLSLERYLGTHRGYHSNEPFEFTRRHLSELEAQDIATLTQPERYWLLAEEGDEVLDTRLAVARYAGARQDVLPGGDHSFTRWETFLDGIIDFAANAP